MIVPKVYIAEKLYAKLCKTIKEINILLCVNDNTFKEFHKALNGQLNKLLGHTTLYPNV